MVADSLDVGGAERHVVALASGLAERGHDVRLACSAGRPAPRRRRGRRSAGRDHGAGGREAAGEHRVRRIRRR